MFDAAFVIANTKFEFCIKSKLHAEPAILHATVKLLVVAEVIVAKVIGAKVIDTKNIIQ